MSITLLLNNCYYRLNNIKCPYIVNIKIYKSLISDIIFCKNMINIHFQIYDYGNTSGY